MPFQIEFFVNALEQTTRLYGFFIMKSRNVCFQVGALRKCPFAKKAFMLPSMVSLIGAESRIAVLNLTGKIIIQNYAPMGIPDSIVGCPKIPPIVIILCFFSLKKLFPGQEICTEDKSSTVAKILTPHLYYSSVHYRSIKSFCGCARAQTL